MSLPDVATHEEWLVARKALLEKEKAMTRARDALNAERRRMPMVEVTKPYRFTGPDGEVGLLDLFDGRRQLIVGHFMFDPEWEDGCPSCTARVDEMSAGFFEHLHARDTSHAEVSRAPLAKLDAYKAKRGWDVPWYSSFGSDFNYDFHVTIDPAVAPVEYNFRSGEQWEATQPGALGTGEVPGASFFLRDGDRVFHTNSTYARGAEMTGGSYYWLDLTALGRQEEWEEPKGRSGASRSATPNFEA